MSLIAESYRKLSRSQRILYLGIVFIIVAVLATGCRDDGATPEATSAPPAPTAMPEPTETPSVQAEDFVTIATDAPFPPFATFDEFGTVVGFDAELAESLMSRAGYEYEFVVTNFDGMLESVASGEFDMAMTALSDAEPMEGISYTEPYLEVGQVLVVLANEETLQNYQTIPPRVPIGVLADSLAGQRAAMEIAGISEEFLVFFETVGQALQALINGDIRGVILDHDDAQHFTRTHFEQLKIAGGDGREAWMTHDEYVIAVSDTRPELLEDLNGAIAEAENDGTVERVTRNWLVSEETIDAGESLIGTPEDIIVIGVLGQLDNVDPAAPPSKIGWELKYNTMSGLYMLDEENNLVPVLAEGTPEVSESRLEYTITLRSGLTFPNGDPLTAEDVRWSITRAGSLGSWHVNAFLKDEDENQIADADAVQVVDSNRIQITLNEPASFFPYLLATPPYFVIGEECYNTNPDAARLCNGFGPYEIIEWQDGETIQLQENPQWSGPGQATFENIQLRFYADAASLQNALELGAIDIAWGDLPPAATASMLQLADVQAWDGSPTFKSYLVFQHEDTPWSSAPVRQAVAYAVDREALAEVMAQERREPLYSPLPDGVPQQAPTEPQRNLARAQELLRLAGYSESSPLVVPLWYLNDGRYSAQEEAYAQALAQQLEETGMIDVELSGESWDVYGAEISECGYATFLLGWPPVGWPTRYPAAMGWLEYFVRNTDTLCSNYESAAMTSLIDQARRLDPADSAGQQAIYEQIQALWAQEYPTLDLTQAGPRLIAHEAIEGVTLDRMGLLRYGPLTKAGE